MPAKTPEPLFHTPDDQLSKVEKAKLSSNMIRGTLPEEFRDSETPDITGDAEQLAKSHGIYLEYNRAKTGREKDWMYMIRLAAHGGGSFTRDQWHTLDQCASKYGDNNPFGGASLRITTRQTLQFHWVKKPQMLSMIQTIAKSGFYTLNGCGDNVRNVMACPMSKFSNVYDANAKGREYGKYFRLPMAPHIEVFAIDPNADPNDPDAQGYDYGNKLLNRKFKIAFSSVTRDAEGNLTPDNCVEMRSNDVGVAPIVENDQVVAYQVFIGGGQGEKNGKPTFATLGKPLCVFTEDNLQKGLHSIVKVHEEWGDRKNRHWARLKYVVNKQGIPWYQEQIKEKGAEFSMPIPDFDPGPRMLHHGWTKQETDGKWTYGAYIECGRLVDTEEGDDPGHQSGNVTGNGKLKTMVRETLDAFDGLELTLTPNQDILFHNIPAEAKEDFEAKLAEYGYGTRKGKTYSTLRVLSGACVGLPTCRLSYTDSEQFEPELLDQLEEMGYGDVNESIGITGCERQCFRPATKTFGWVGQGPDMYMLKLGGSEDGRHQGTALVHEDQLWLRQVPRDKVATVTATLIELAKANGYNNGGGTDMGEVFRSLGTRKILDTLRENEETADLFDKSHPPVYQPDGPTTG